MGSHFFSRHSVNSVPVSHSISYFPLRTASYANVKRQIQAAERSNSLQLGKMALRLQHFRPITRAIQYQSILKELDVSGINSSIIDYFLLYCFELFFLEIGHRDVMPLHVFLLSLLFGHCFFYQLCQAGKL